REDGAEGKRLVGYVTLEEGAAVGVEEWREGLRRKLPEYMVPTTWVVLEALPVTANGKVDRRALPAPGLTDSRRDEYVAPRTETEAVLASLWATVLNQSKVGLRDDFFALGGHSLLATQLVSRIRESLAIELPLRAIFEAPTVEALAERLKQSRAEASGILAPPLNRMARREAPPLSFAQQRLWFLAQLEPTSTVYHVPLVVRLTGTLDEEALAYSFDALIARHESLRTTFGVHDGDPVQRISAHALSSLQRVDLRGRARDSVDADVRRHIEDVVTRPFDLEQGPLLRTVLLTLSDQEHVLALVMHHIVSDGWSMGVLVAELTALYSARVRGVAASLPPLPIQYADYAVWQREWLRGDVLDSQIAYWRRQLAGAPRALELLTDRPRPAVQSMEGAALPFSLGRALSDAIKALAQREGATPYMVLLTAYQVVLARNAGQEEVCVGSPIANRTRGETEGLLGFFVNTVVMRTQVKGNARFRDVLKQVRETTLGAYAHQDVPFEKLVEALRPERDLSRSPLFQAMFTLDSTPKSSGHTMPGLSLRPLSVEHRVARFDLSLGLVDGEDGFVGELEYATALFDAETVERWGRQVKELVEAGVKESGVRVREVMGEEERWRVVKGWNETGRSEGGETLLHELVEEQARRTPEAVAVVSGEREVRYRELEERANGVAWRLREAGVKAEEKVGVCAGRTWEVVVAVLGVLKAGGAYVPLDASYPRERLEGMVEDGKVRVVVGQREEMERVGLKGVERVELGEERREEGPKGGVSARQLAYVLYTSGSTGRPKGVGVEHRSAVSFVRWSWEAFGEEEMRSVLGATSLNFDLSVFEVFGPLTRGGKVVVVGSALEMGEVEGKGVTLVNTVPSAMREAVRSGWVPRSVRVVNLAGEELRRELVEEIGRRAPWVERVVNLYGPTEDTTYSTWVEVKRWEKKEPGIGRPLKGRRAYVLDEEGRVVGEGVAGELYLGGEGQARGYEGKAGQTAERFVPDEYSGEEGARLYRTGDRARWVRGELEYLGRVDAQVKVRGYRVELGEVEGALREEEGVREAVVV
ncbi:amino acid adenylation domain-containing protein, partial [Corallococcus sp. M34]|uniref:non-ribosomal peptide synthetase n=1 Tax=Citreicoccus inhibens TaxID=2849499 RepID=UPI001C23D8BD